MADFSVLSGVSLFMYLFVYSHLMFFQAITVHEYPEFVKIVEVGPRDGLQNEKVHSVTSVTNLIYIYGHLCFLLLYTIHPGNSHFLYI